MPERPLWSERQGGSLPLSKEGFATLLVDALDRLTEQGYFAEVLELGVRPWSRRSHRGDTARAFFSMKLGDPWAADAMGSVVSIQHADDARTFDVLELLHRDVVSAPFADPEPPRRRYDKAAGRETFRARVNPILARRDPPLEMDATGTIVQRIAEPFRRLVEQPLPDTAAKREVVDRVDDAVAHFRRREATAGGSPCRGA